MMHLLSILPALLCVGLMFGAGAALRLASRTPLARLPWIARHHPERPERAEDSGREGRR